MGGVLAADGDEAQCGGQPIRSWACHARTRQSTNRRNGSGLTAGFTSMRPYWRYQKRKSGCLLADYGPWPLNQGDVVTLRRICPIAG